MINYLLQDNQEGLDQIFMFCWISSAHFNVVVERCCHDLWVFITKCTLHFDFKLLDRHDLVKFHHDDHSFFPDHLVLVGKQLVNSVANRQHHLLIHYFSQHCESCKHLEMSLGLQISLQGCNHQDNHV